MGYISWSAVLGLRGADLEAALAARLAARPAGEWVNLLSAGGIGAQPVISVTPLMQDPWVIAHGLSITREHGSGERITTIGPPAHLSRTPHFPAGRFRRRAGTPRRSSRASAWRIGSMTWSPGGSSR